MMDEVVGLVHNNNNINTTSRRVMDIRNVIPITITAVDELQVHDDDRAVVVVIE